MSEHKIARYVDGQLGADERIEVEQHIASCPECARAVGEIYRAVHRTIEPGDEHEPDRSVLRAAGALADESARTGRSARVRWRWAAVVVLCVASVAAFLVLNSGDSEVSRVRAGEVESQVQLIAPEDGVRLARAPALLRVSEAEEALTYQFEVTTPTGEPVLQESSDNPVLSIQDRDSWQAGTYHWSVQVLHRSGRLIESDTRVFTIEQN